MLIIGAPHRHVPMDRSVYSSTANCWQCRLVIGHCWDTLLRAGSG